MIGVGVIGYGYWGPNLARNFAESETMRLVAVCDRDASRLDRARRRHPECRHYERMEDLLEDPALAAVAIATPVRTHEEVAWAALNAGKHVLLEKPMTSNSTAAERLVAEAQRRGLVLMVDHTFLYTPAVRKLHQLLCQGDLGELYYYDSVRVNLGVFQQDASVLWDLAVHDLAIMDYLLPEKPVAVSACGQSHLPGQPANVAFLTFYFASKLIAHVHVNWLAPVKLRRTVLCGSQRMVVYDDLETSDKLKVYDRGLKLTDSADHRHQLLVSYRTGDMWAPHLELTEALRIEVEHFAACIRDGTPPLSDGVAGLRIVRLLEAAARSMAQRGQPVELLS